MPDSKKPFKKPFIPKCATCKASHRTSDCPFDASVRAALAGYQQRDQEAKAEKEKEGKRPREEEKKEEKTKKPRPEHKTPAEVTTEAECLEAENRLTNKADEDQKRVDRYRDLVRQYAARRAEIAAAKDAMVVDSTEKLPQPQPQPQPQEKEKADPLAGDFHITV
ncbi:hypothetical protein PENDEC_c008G04924 [Penicillium decumbens]|uniref:Uncharacterized protein n=1 Tax=Penicillium decumbens TaxID=69771 RepID=A0A1V6PE74_PENDC|nr:hypothetical protein PENDEC_c008G04924 [Penicillium decumbens]